MTQPQNPKEWKGYIEQIRDLKNILDESYHADIDRFADELILLINVAENENSKEL